MSDTFSKELCEKEHKQVSKTLEHHESWLKEHEGKIDTLTRSDAVNSTEIKNLCKSIGSQTKAIWGLVTGIAFVLVGFLIWYIQSLPRG